MDLDCQTMEIKQEVETNCLKSIKDEPTENCSEFDCVADPLEDVKLEDNAAVHIKSEESETCTIMSEEEDTPDLIQIKTEKIAASDLELDSATKNDDWQSESEEINSEPVNETFTCYICSYKTYCKDDLVKHITIYCCTQCPESFKTEVGLYNHMVKMHNECATSFSSAIFKCRCCCHKTANFGDFKKHLWQHTGVSSSTQDCESSDFRSTHKGDFGDDHSMLVQLTKCKFCDAKFDKASSLARHVLRSHPNFVSPVPSKVHVCLNCDYTSASTSDLKKHMLKHAISVSKIFMCIHCNASFEQKPLLDDHILKNHRVSVSSELFECTKCDYVGHKSYFNRHMLIHASKVDKLYTCKCCNSTFESKLSIDEHMLKRHPNFITLVNSEIFQCTYCDFKTSRKNNLDRHATIHDTDIPSKSGCAVESIDGTTYTCSDCGCKFTITNDIQKKKNHGSVSNKYKCSRCRYKTAKKHYREKRVLHIDNYSTISTCSQCNAVFKNEQILGEHIIKDHPNFIGAISCEIFECIYCAYKTTWSCKFSHHMMEHTGKPVKVQAL